MPRLSVDLDNPQDIVNSMELLNVTLSLHQQAQAQAQPAVAQPAPCAPVAPAPAVAPPGPIVPQATQATPQVAPPVAPAAPAPAAAPAQQVDTTMLQQRLKDLTRQLGPQANQVGPLIQAYGVTKMSELQPEQLQAVLTQVEQMVAANG